ncbi:MAG: hypothetical protein FJY09_08560 [Chlorobi bacterium]|nr:hypothetical protein [Chlorobiota bacterium]
MNLRQLIKAEWNSGSKLTGYWLLGFLLLLAGSLIPFGIPGLDTIAHITLYAVLSCIPISFLSDRKAAFLVSTAMSSLGYLLETIHMFVTGDSFNALNALANNIGILAGIAAGFIIRLKLHYEQRYNNDTGRKP